eukprot:1780226-Amphidinium_carterae.1
MKARIAPALAGGLVVCGVRAQGVLAGLLTQETNKRPCDAPLAKLPTRQTPDKQKGPFNCYRTLRLEYMLWGFLGLRSLGFERLFLEQSDKLADRVDLQKGNITKLQT